MTEKQVEIRAQVHREDGMYWAEVLDHPGLFASGETLDELKEALAEAWFLYTQDTTASTHANSPNGSAPGAAPSAKSNASERPTARVDQLQLLVPA